MAEFRFPATVDDDGKLCMPEVAAHGLRTMAGKSVVVTVETAAQRRSAQANRFWWAVVVPTFQDVWSLARMQQGLPPYDKDQTHDVLVQVLVGFEDGPLPGSRVRKATSAMESPEFRKMVEAARELALHSYGMYIPEPGERVED